MTTTPDGIKVLIRCPSHCRADRATRPHGSTQDSVVFAKSAFLGSSDHPENGADRAVSRTQNGSHKQKLNRVPNSGGEESTKATQDCRNRVCYSKHSIWGVSMNRIGLTSFFYTLVPWLQIAKLRINFLLLRQLVLSSYKVFVLDLITPQCNTDLAAGK
jgi:hypothetical protein